MVPATSLSVSQSAFQQLRVQQAERAAQLAEEQARMLQLQAQSARREASRAQQEARDLQAQSNQAGVNASNARQRAAAERANVRLASELEQRLQSQVRQDAPVANTLGQLVGRVVHAIA
jgi:hypothetical protein